MIKIFWPFLETTHPTFLRIELNRIISVWIAHIYSVAMIVVHSELFKQAIEFEEHAKKNVNMIISLRIVFAFTFVFYPLVVFIVTICSVRVQLFLDLWRLKISRRCQWNRNFCFFLNSIQRSRIKLWRIFSSMPSQAFFFDSPWK